MALLQRQFGKLLKRTADDATVGQLIIDVKNYDERLDVLIEGLRHWQQAVAQLLIHQKAISNQLNVLYKPIHTEIKTSLEQVDQEKLRRIEEWGSVTEDMRNELMNQTKNITRVTEQAVGVKAALKPIKKVLEKRENSKLDYERYSQNYDAAKKKGGRSERERGVQSKAEIQLEEATKVYNAHDDHIRQYVPPMLDAIGTFIPYVMYAVEGMHYDFISHKYTIIYEFAQKYGLDNYAHFEQEWQENHLPVKEQMEEELTVLRDGKGIRAPLEPPTPPAEKGSKFAPPNLFRRRTSDLPKLERTKSNNPSIHSEADSPVGSRPMSRQASSSSAFEKQAPPRPISRRASSNLFGKASDSSQRPEMVKIPSTNSIKIGAYRDYQSGTSTPSGYPNGGLSTRASSASLASAAAAAAQKKKPPPPPVKPKPKVKKDLYVVALYTFEAREATDLPLKEGDRVRVIASTDTAEDWWEGECLQRDGSTRRGFFPANYCQPE